MTEKNKQHNIDKADELEKVTRELKHTEVLLDTLLSRICSTCAEVDIKTKKALIRKFSDGTQKEVEFKPMIETLANVSVAEHEVQRYIQTYDFDNILNYLRSNNNFHTETFEGKSSDGQIFIVISTFLVVNPDDMSEKMFSYSQDITEIEFLKKEKKYGEGLLFNKTMTYEANLTKDIIVYCDKEWLDTANVEYIDVFSQLLPRVCKNVISPQFRDYLDMTVNKEYLLNAYHSGQRLLTLEYKRRIPSGEYEWYEQTLNIINDEKTGDIIVRCYTININERKEYELKIIGERRHYENIFAKSICSYEINITRNTVLKGHEEWLETFGIQGTNNYTELIKMLAKKGIHQEDRESFLTIFARQNVVENFENSINEMTCDYRRLNKSGNFAWYRCTMHTFDDPITGDVRAFSYIEDIEEEKQKELKLIYRSEHDLLTDLYNKMTTQEKIQEFLSISDMKYSNHALLMVDLDYFKDINDNFGHAFGDAVLSSVGTKLHSLFREDDIIGRIGGDEFIILMKNVSGEKGVELKAQEICDTLKETYHHDTHDYNICASVGVALYSKHGKSYDELYKKSDTALYHSKHHGRNMYSIYNDNMGEAETNIKDIDKDRLVITGSTSENVISQHAFRILYESPNKYTAISAVLELMGKHYKASRAYVFENTLDDKCLDNTFEWCAEGIEPQMEKLQGLEYEQLGNYRECFNVDDVFYMPDIREFVNISKPLLEEQGIKSMVHVAFVKNGRFSGFVGFDFVDDYTNFGKNELVEYKTVANIIGVFVAEMRIMKENADARKTALSVVNGLDSYTYVCDPKTYRVLFINDKAYEIAPNAKIGDTCYVAFWNSQEPCENCPMRKLVNTNADRVSEEMYNTNFDIWVKATTSWIDWLGEKKVCLVDSIDITKYKK